MDEFDDGPSWIRPLPGDPRPVLGEIERLTKLKEQLWAAADVLDQIAVTWSGQSHDQFVQYRDRLSGAVRTAGDLHEVAACALADYHQVMAALKPLADDLAATASHGGDPARAASAWSDIHRLWTQWKEAGLQAALSIAECSMALTELSQRPEIPVVSPAATVEPPSTNSSHRRVRALDPTVLSAMSFCPDPSTATADPAKFSRLMRILAAEVLIGVHQVVDPGERL